MKPIGETVKKIFPAEPPEWLLTEPPDTCPECHDIGVRIYRITFREYYGKRGVPKYKDPNALVTVAEPCKCVAFKSRAKSFLAAVERLPVELKDATFNTVTKAEAYKRDALQAAELWVDAVAEGRKSVLVFSGPTGRGKTFLATAAIRAVFEAGGIPGFITSREFCDDIRELAHDTRRCRQYVEDLRKRPLVLDDFGRERFGNAEGAVLSSYAILLSGYELGGQLIMTTNRDFKTALIETFGDESAAIARRLAPVQIKFLKDSEKL